MTDDRVLVVNADDFGLTTGVCAGILRAAEHGIVRSTSVLANAPAFEANAGRLRDSGLATGLHLCAVGEDPPLLTAAEVPSLVDAAGRFPATWRQFCSQAATGRVDPDDLAREFDAQADACLGSGLRLSHIDAHQNLQLWPSVGQLAVTLAQRHGARVVRVPSTRRVGATSLGVRSLGIAARRRVRRNQLVVPDHAAGLDTAGQMSQSTMMATIEYLGRLGGHADLAVHPGEAFDPDRARYRWDYSWPNELIALCSPEVASAVSAAGFTLGSFVDLAALVDQHD